MKAIVRSLGVLIAMCMSALAADEAAVVAKLEKVVKSPKSLRLKKDRKTGKVVELALNAPDLQNSDLAIFNELKHLQRLTISHAGYANGKKSGVDFSGVAVLKEHPSLRYFSAGGAVGKEYLAALAKLRNVPELYIQTTHSLDADWQPIGAMTHLKYLGIRVRNDRMSKLTEGMFGHLKPLKNLERFMVSEMTFKHPQPFVDLVTALPKLKELTIRRCVGLPDAALTLIRSAKPDVAIVIVDR